MAHIVNLVGYNVSSEIGTGKYDVSDYLGEMEALHLVIGTEDYDCRLSNNKGRITTFVVLTGTDEEPIISLASYLKADGKSVTLNRIDRLEKLPTGADSGRVMGIVKAGLVVHWNKIGSPITQGFSIRIDECLSSIEEDITQII